MRHDYRSVIGYKARLAERIRNLDPSLANELRDIRLPWYTIKNAGDEPPSPDKEETEQPAAEVFIYDEIGGSLGVSADDFVQELQGITSKQIDVRINSPGGSVFDAIAIYNALVKHPANVTTYVDALAASAASVIAMAGDECVMMVGSQLMIHDALGIEMGNAKNMREMADFLDRQSDNIAGVYANKGGGEIADWRAMMLAETWMFAQEAVDFGLADSVYTRAAKQATEETELEPENEPDAVPEEETEDPPEDEEAPEEDDEEELDALMHAKHRLVNRGFKYTGRNKAPTPKVTNRKRRDDFDVDAIIDAFQSTLG